MARRGSRDPKRRRELCAALWKAQDGRCWWCKRCLVPMGTRTPSGRHPNAAATFDHLVPRSLGGSNYRSNLVLACDRCNQLRGNDVAWKPSASYLAKLERAGAMLRPVVGFPLAPLTQAAA